MSLEEFAKRVVVKDACVIFDLIDLNLLDYFFELDIEVLTTPNVIIEVKDQTQINIVNNHLTNGNIIIDNDGDDETIFSFFDQYPGLTLTDCSVLELAIRKRLVLLSSDGSLRKIATRRQLEVRGTLWVIKELVELKIISSAAALEKLELYPRINKRVPIKEIKQLVDYLLNYR